MEGYFVMFPWGFEGNPAAEDRKICCVIGHKMGVQGQQADECDVDEEESVHDDVSAWDFTFIDSHRNRVICSLNYGQVERVPDSSPSKLLKLYFLLNFVQIFYPNMAS